MQNLEQQKFQSKNPFNYYNYRLKEDDLTIAIQTTQNIIHSQKLFDIKRLGDLAAIKLIRNVDRKKNGFHEFTIASYVMLILLMKTLV